MASIYFGFRTDGQAGGGTSANDPVDCTSHAQMDAAMAHYNASNNSLFFAAGTYQWSGYTIGTGPDNAFSNSSWNGPATGTATFQLTTTAASACFLSNGLNGWISNFTVQNIVFDCQGTQTSGTYRAAIQLGGGDHVTIQNCAFQDFCAASSAKDCDVVRLTADSTADASGHTFGNNLIHSNTFAQPAPGNNGGAANLITMRYVPGVSVTAGTNVVSNNTFDHCDSDFAGLRCIVEAPHVNNNYAIECSTFYYAAPTVPQTFSVLLQDNRIQNGGNFFVLRWGPLSAGGAKTSSQQPVATWGPTTIRSNRYVRRPVVSGVSTLNKNSGAFMLFDNQLPYLSSGTHDTGTYYYAGPPSIQSLLVEKNWINDYAYDPTGSYLLNLYDRQPTQGIALNQVVVRKNFICCAPNREMVLDARKGTGGVLRQFLATGNTTIPKDGGDRSVHLTDQLLKLIYATQYGPQVFYDDSWGTAGGPPLAYNIEALRTIVRYAKNVLGMDILLVPEMYGDYACYSASSPYNAAAKNVMSSPDPVRSMWSEARGTIYWQTKGSADSTGPAIIMWPQGDSRNNSTTATTINNTIGYAKTAYAARDHIIAQCVSGTPTDCQMIANMINLIDQKLL